MKTTEQEKESIVKMRCTFCNKESIINWLIKKNKISLCGNCYASIHMT